MGVLTVLIMIKLTSPLFTWPAVAMFFQYIDDVNTNIYQIYTGTFYTMYIVLNVQCTHDV